MNSEDIASYVAGLEAEVERERTRADRNADAVNANAHIIVQLRGEVERLRAAQLSDLPHVGPVQRDPFGQIWIGKEMWDDDTPREDRKRDLAERIAADAFLDAEAATQDTTPETVTTCEDVTPHGPHNWIGREEQWLDCPGVTGRDDTRTPEPLTVETLADVIRRVTDLGSHEDAARAVLGLIGDRYVPRADYDRQLERVRDMAIDANAEWIREKDAHEAFRAAVLNLAQHWEKLDIYDGYLCAAELRALTEQENQP